MTGEIHPEKRDRQEKMLSLWDHMLPESFNKHSFSNTVHLYDAIPKYVLGNQPRTYQKSIERTITFKGTRFRVTITPARVANVYKRNADEQDEIDVFPGETEELVEMAIRKAAIDGDGLFFEDRYGTLLSLYKIQKTLADAGKSRNLTRIKRAIEICARTILTITPEGGKDSVISTQIIAPIFQEVVLRTQEDWQEHGKESQAYVKFHTLVTKSILEFTHRPFVFANYIQFSNFIARRLYTILTHNFTQASFSTKYTVNLTTLIDQIGFKPRATMRKSFDAFKNGAQELIELGLILEIEGDEVRDMDNPRKIVDFQVSISPGAKFSQEMKKLNSIVKGRTEKGIDQGVFAGEKARKLSNK